MPQPVTSTGRSDEITASSPLPDRLRELERRISVALSEPTSAHDLHNLLQQINLAIPAADEFAKLENEDPLQSPDPRAARQQADDAQFASNRLRTLRPRLLARYQQVSAAEQREQYLAQYTDLKREGAALAQELADLYPGLVGPLVEVFVRLRAFQQKCRALHLADPGGLPLVDDPELAARRLDGFSRDMPSRLELCTCTIGNRARKSGRRRRISPPPMRASMGVPQHPGAAWADPFYQERRRAELAAEQERLALHALARQKEQEIRQNEELKAQWQARQRA